MPTADTIQQAFEQVEAANRLFYEGDPAPQMGVWSHADDVTFCGAWGAYERSWERVGPRLEWAAARFRGGHIDHEPLAMEESGDLAYTVYLEKGEARVEGMDEYRPLALRVTLIFRREGGAWKIIHRHADPILQKTEATVILQQ
jgi:ketosteroid isomerase-like protein